MNELAALNMEHPDVFAATHKLILQLLDAGVVTGLRIDHPDGLYDPRQYLERLQRHALLERAQAVAVRTGLDWEGIQEPFDRWIADNPQICRIQTDAAAPRWPLYVVVEKILIGDESLPTDWPVYGTTGYDFLQLAGGLFIDRSNEQALARIYHDWIGETIRFTDCRTSKNRSSCKSRSAASCRC